MTNSPKRRLEAVQRSLLPPPPTIGKLSLGGIEYDVPISVAPSRLPHLSPNDSLDIQDSFNQDNLHFLLQKYLLGQDVFLVSQPGPYARRLVMSFCSLINSEYEYVALHRDVGETELKQGREIRAGGSLSYVDSAAVRAVKNGRILILEGVERAERGIMPLLNNLLENREMNLDDGTHIVHPAKYDLLTSDEIHSGERSKFIPAHAAFRVVAIAAPVPPYPGYPLDPPFRSRFQARFIDPVGAMIALEGPNQFSNGENRSVFAEKLRTVILTAQYASETRNNLEAISRTSATLPPFPQTALLKLRLLCEAYPVGFVKGVPPITPDQLAKVVLTLHPGLLTAPFRAWATLSEQTDDAGLGPLGTPSGSCDNMDEVDAGAGLMGYRAISVSRNTERTAWVTFERNGSRITHCVPTGPGVLLPFPLPVGLPLGTLCYGGARPASAYTETLIATPRFLSSLSTLLQAHALKTSLDESESVRRGFDISLLPPVLPFSASCSTSTIVRVFSAILGYSETREDVHLYKELGGRELIMRREIVDEGISKQGMGATTWKPSALIQGARNGDLVHFSGIDVIGSTAGSIARLCQDREIELWDGNRIVAELSEIEAKDGPVGLIPVHHSFRVLATASKSMTLRDWMTAEHANMFFPILTLPMDVDEECAVLEQTGASKVLIDRLIIFAKRYRDTMSTSHVPKSASSGASALAFSGADGAESIRRHRKLGTRTLVRMARRIAKVPWDDDLYRMIIRNLLAEFLPTTERMALETLLEETGLRRLSDVNNAPPELIEGGLRFRITPRAESRSSNGDTQAVLIPHFNEEHDPEGVASHVPHMQLFYDNSLQTGLMRDMAIELELLGEHLVLLGNQGVGKNKIIDRLCQLLGRPREYIQLHRDTTVNQLMFTTTLEQGVLKHTDSPLLRAIKSGRVIVVDEADKAPAHVVAVFRSLGGYGEMTLSDGRRVRSGVVTGREGDILVHTNFRMILLANRPGYPFLGNHFLQVLGENFSCHSVSNPDMTSENQLLRQLAPEIDADTLRKLVLAFQDLRCGYDSGKLMYPYSLRELINLVRHMRTYPDDSLEGALRNIFDFDIYKPETIDFLADVLDRHGLKVHRLGLELAREAASKKQKEVKFEPKSNESLQGPKKGLEDPDNEEHVGGGTWAGGSGGRDTAGLGGRGGYMRLYKGHEIKQISDEMKKDVPEHVKEKAREMARLELARKLEELNMSLGEAQEYGALLNEVQAHIAQLYDLLENLSAREEERVWVKRQTDGELDDSRLTEGMTGESTVYKRRGVDKPELGRPQIKPKRIRFVFDISGSMYRFQYDGRLQRSLETAVMIMETFDRLSRKDKYVWDIYGHSGDSPTIPLVEFGSPPTEIKDRWKVIQKMNLMTQYAFAGDYTLEAIEKAIDDVGRFEADDWFVIAISDANFGRYGITAQDLKRVMDRNPKVHTAMICIGEGAEAAWIPKTFMGRAFRLVDTHDIPKVLRSILSTMVDQ